MKPEATPGLPTGSGNMTLTYEKNEKETKQQAWSITEISRSHYEQDLPQCTCQLERDCAYAMNRREMRRIRDAKLAEGRKLTPGEISTLSAWGLLPATADSFNSLLPSITTPSPATVTNTSSLFQTGNTFGARWKSRLQRRLQPDSLI